MPEILFKKLNVKELRNTKAGGDIFSDAYKSTPTVDTPDCDTKDDLPDGEKTCSPPKQDPGKCETAP